MKLFKLASSLLFACLAAPIPAWSASGLFDQRNVMTENARLSDAEEMLQQWLANHPEDQEARFLLARVLAWQDKHAEARKQYELLLHKEPGNSDFLAGMAMVPMETPRPESPNDQKHSLGIHSQH